jgi:hypothetical protein
LNSTELLAAVRRAARIADTHPDWTDAVLLEELTQTLRTVFVRAMVESGEGYWRQPHYQQLTTGVAAYPMPPRAAQQTLWGVEYRAAATSGGCTDCSLSAGTFSTLTRASYQDSAAQESTTDTPKRWLEYGDHFRLVPTPNTNNAQIRCWYPVRPPALVAAQLATADGVVTTSSPGSKTITVTGTPRGPSGGGGSALGSSGGYRIDVVSPNGGHELHLVGALVASFAAGVFTLTCPPQDMARIQAGDLVRYADESELPMLPREYHQTLAEATAAAVLVRMGVQARAEMLSGKVQADLERMKVIATPRTKDTPRHRDGSASA